MSIFTLPSPKLSDPDPNKIKLSLIAFWEEDHGMPLPQPSFEYDLILNQAQQLSLIVSGLNYNASQNYLPFSSGVNLDNFVNSFGITRIPSKFAVVYIRIAPDGVLVNDFTIYAGHEIQSDDGAYIFKINEDTVILKNTLLSDQILCTCTTAGSLANNYIHDTIKNNLDTVGFDPIDNAVWSNPDDISSGGGDIETDTELRARAVIFLEKYTTAGSQKAYEYWARSYSTNIVDVNASSLPNTGVADIYVLEKNGTIPSQATLDLIKSYLSKDELRPMCDEVNVQAPSGVSYTTAGIIDYIPGYGGVIDEILQQVEDIAKIWTIDNSNTLGKDIIRNELIGLCMSIEGVADIRLTEPAVNITLTAGQFPEHDGNYTFTKGNPVA